MTRQQMEFIRKHGITMCPPGPVTTMCWHAWSEHKATESELIANAARRWPVLPLKAGKGFANLASASGRMGREGKGCRS